MDDYIGKVQALPNLPLSTYSADVYDLALLMLEESNYNIKTALDKIRRVTKDDFAFLVTWRPDEIQAFEQSIQDNGHELFYAKKRIPTKSMADIVRFFYQWKKSDRYEPVYSVWTKVFKPAKQFKKNTRSILDCLGKHQQNDQSIVKAFPLHQQEDKNTTNSTNGVKQKRSDGGGKKKRVPTTTSTAAAATAATKDGNSIYISDTSSESDSDDEDDDPDDKNYQKPRNIRVRTFDTTMDSSTDTQARPLRITRQSTSLAKLATTTENLPASGNTKSSKDRKLDDDNDSSDDENDADSMEMIDDPTVIPLDAINNNGQPLECDNCYTTQSTVWRRVAGDADRKQKVFDRALCDDCGTHWLKYSKKRPVKSLMLETNGVVAGVRLRGRPSK